MHDATVLDVENSYLTRSTDATYAPVAANTTFTLPSNNATAGNGTSYPAIAVSLALGTALLRVDVQPVLQAKPYGYSNSTEVLGIQTLGNIYGFPEEYVPRGATVSSWDGLLADGTMAPAGIYRLVVRALHIFGDRGEAEEYDVASSVPFTIRYA